MKPGKLSYGMLLMLHAMVPVSALKAAETLGGLDGVMQGGEGLQFPSLLRVFGGFVVTAGLFVAMTWLFRTGLSRFGAGKIPGRAAMVQSRSRPAPGLVLTVVEVEGRRLLITESRNGLHVLPLSQVEEARATNREAVDAPR